MRLLLAEDERSLSRAIVTILKRNDYTVDAAYDGEEALECLESGNYDAAILDIMMPKTDGLTVLKTIRGRGDQIPILLLTARSEIDDKVEGLDLGANDYLSKPFATKELLARIRAMTRTQAQSSLPPLAAGNITLDRSTYELKSPVGSFRLSNREFQTLELLMTNPGHAISSERFLEKLWNGEPDTEKQVVWVYISYLKKKLHALHADVQIVVTSETEYALKRIDAERRAI
ncbi:MAG: response regulator transcription factor [Clostridiales bacterium]|nr:response regulator transcription factor [Clostridiales bacterium]